MFDVVRFFVCLISYRALLIQKMSVLCLSDVLHAISLFPSSLVGYSWMPLLKDGRMQSLDVQLPVAATLPVGYLCQDAKKVQPHAAALHAKTHLTSSCIFFFFIQNKYHIMVCVPCPLSSPSQISSGWKMPRLSSK